jgi:hypothetical protein
MFRISFHIFLPCGFEVRLYEASFAFVGRRVEQDSQWR